MKETVIMTICIIAFVAFAAFWALGTISTTCDELVEALEKSIDAAKVGDYTSCDEHLNEMTSIWGKNKWKWELIIDHHELDDIQYSIARLEMLLEMEDDQFLVDAAGLAYDFSHIKKKEYPALENIL